MPTTQPGTPSLTAQVIDLGEGLRELTGFQAQSWGDGSPDDDVESRTKVSGVMVDPAGNVFVLTQWMGGYSNGNWYGPGPVREGAFRLEELSSSSATFSLVADGPGDRRLVYEATQLVYGASWRYRWDTMGRFLGYLTPTATPSPDVVRLVAQDGSLHRPDQQIRPYKYEDGQAWSSGVLGEDAQDRWLPADGQTITLAGLPLAWWPGEPNGGPAGGEGSPARDPLAWPLSVGTRTSVRVKPSGGGNLVWVLHPDQAAWVSLTAPTPWPIPGNWSNPVAWVWAHTQYAPARQGVAAAHWMWAGNAYGRIFFLPDK